MSHTPDAFHKCKILRATSRSNSINSDMSEWPSRHREVDEAQNNLQTLYQNKTLWC